MKTLADIKRRATVGTTLTMTHFVVRGIEKNGPLVGLPRKVKRVQGNGIQFEPHKDGSEGSWLWWPSAKEISINGSSFTINGDIALTYQFQE